MYGIIGKIKKPVPSTANIVTISLSSMFLSSTSFPSSIIQVGSPRKSPTYFKMFFNGVQTPVDSAISLISAFSRLASSWISSGTWVMMSHTPLPTLPPTPSAPSTTEVEETRTIRTEEVRRNMVEVRRSSGCYWSAG